MGKLLMFQIALLESDIWDVIDPNSGSTVAVVSAKIDNPVVKTDTVDINTNDGVMDFSEAQGLHYGNRNIEVTLRKTSGSTYDFDAFRRKYLGRMVKCMFEEVTQTTGQYYYYGRLIDITDDYKSDFRTVNLTIDANPFRRSTFAPMTTNVTINASGNLMPATSSATIETVASLGTMQYSYVDDYPAKSITTFISGGPSSQGHGTLYLTVSGLEPGKVYHFNVGHATNGGSVTIRDATKNGTIIKDKIKGNALDDPEFTSVSSTIVLCFNVASGNTRFGFISLFLSDFTSTHLINGDKIQTPTYEALTQDVVVNVNGKQTTLYAGSTSNPYFTIPSGGCDITATGETAGILKLSYEQEML